jgi:hypothetical protein
MHTPDASAFMESFEKEYPKCWPGVGVGYVGVRVGDYTDKMWAIPSYWDVGGNIVILDYFVMGFSWQWLPVVNLGVGNRFIAWRGWIDYLSLLGDLDQFNYGTGLVQQVIPTENFRFGFEENFSHNWYSPYSKRKFDKYEYWELGFGLFFRYRVSTDEKVRSLSLSFRVQRRFFDTYKISEYGKYLYSLSLSMTWADKK